MRSIFAASAGLWVAINAHKPVSRAIFRIRSNTCLDVDCAYYSRLRFDADTLMARCVASWANIRSRLFALPYGDQGLLIHKSLLSSIDGYPSPPIMEDVVIARKLGWRLRALPTMITTSADKYIKQGWTRRGARNLMMLLQFLLGASPEKLYKKYYS